MPQDPRGPALFPMQYQVLARKWRPQYFRDLVGQEQVSRTLLNALQSGRIAHAFLFSGPRGSGKTSTARILAKALNCHQGSTGEPCGNCVACTEISAGNCMDVLEIDAASNTSVDNVRDLIEELQYRPARDRHKIYIIDEVHMLSNSAFNALLKTLEEPPAHVVFILATTEYHKIPATILSRCQQHRFQLIRYPLILERLRRIAQEEGIQISESTLERIVFAGGGSMRDAMSALDQVIAFSGQAVRDEDAEMLLGLVAPAVLASTVRAMATNDVAQILEVVSDMAVAGQDLQSFCRQLLGQFRHLMVLKAGISDPFLLGIPESMVSGLREQADLFSQEDLLRLFDALLRVEADLRHATQTRFQLEMGLIEVAQIPRLRSLEELIEDFRRFVEEKSPPDTGGAPPPFQPSSPGSHGGTVPPARNVPVQETAPSAPLASPRAAPAPTPSPVSKVSGAQESESESEVRGLLDRIAAAVQKESLETILHSLAGARLQGNVVSLELGGTSSDFLRRQLKDNLDLIERAASETAGRPVSVQWEEAPSKAPPNTAGLPAPGKPVIEEDIIERARKEPAVRDFLDTFPGPVKAEKIEP